MKKIEINLTFASHSSLIAMKRIFLFSLLFLASLLSWSQTIQVSGLQSGSWEADTVLVTGDVVVDESLSILPGTTVLFDGYYSILVRKYSKLNAIGTPTDSILFTIADTTGFSVFNAGHGGWNGIRMEKAGACRFDYCRFQYGKAALDEYQDGGALRIFNSIDVELNHSTLFCNFSREHGGALNAENSKVKIQHCDINNNLTYTELDTVYFMYGGAMRFLKCEVDIVDTDFSWNTGSSAIGGALSIDSCSICIDRCRFEHNYGINGGGLYLIRCFDNPCSITNSLFANNTSGHFGGGLAICDSSPLMANLTVVNNTSIGVNCGGIFFYQLSSPEVWNCIVYGNYNSAPLEEPVQMWTWTYDNHAPKFHNCLIQYGLENISNPENITVYENCLDEDPLFADPEEENYRLSSSSPCINAGSPETPAVVLNGFDLDGNPRVSDDCIDIGAYEYDNTSVQESIQNVNVIHIAGNPITSSSYAEIGLSNVCNLFAKIYSIDGKLLVNRNLGTMPAGNNRINVCNLFAFLPSGTYMLVFQSGNKTFVAKVIK